MDMIHLLMPDPSGVDDGAKAIRRPFFAGKFARQRKHFPKRAVLGHACVVERRDMFLRYDQEVDRRLRPGVVERKHILVVVHFPRRDFAADYLAEYAIGIVHFRRAAFSSRPAMPSRRCSSARTSPGPRPWRASRIMQWNQRSAVSRTRCRRSPPFAASTVSVASSPIFLSTASSSAASNPAT